MARKSKSRSRAQTMTVDGIATSVTAEGNLRPEPVVSSGAGGGTSMETVAEYLASLYPLIDTALIWSLLSDYEDPQAHLEEIQDQLGIIDATLVPDVEAEVVPNKLDSSEHAAPPSRSSMGGDRAEDDDVISRQLRDLEVDTGADPGAVPPGIFGSAPLPSSSITTPTDPSSSKSSSWRYQPASGPTSITSTTMSRGASSTSTSSSSPLELGNGSSAGVTELAGQIELLKSLFPALVVRDSRSRKTIKGAILEEPSLHAAIEHLLSVELIHQVEREGRWPEEQRLDGSTDTEDHMPAGVDVGVDVQRPHSSNSTDRPSKYRKSRSRKHKATATPLLDTLQRVPTPQSSTPSSSRPASRSNCHLSTRASSTPSSAGPSSNAWGTIASLSAYLSDLLSQPQSHFLTYFHSPAYRSALSAVRAALVALPSVDEGQSDASRAVLQDIYGLQLSAEPEVARDLELCARVTDDVSVVMDLMDLLAEISEWPGDADDLLESMTVDNPAPAAQTDTSAVVPPTSATNTSMVSPGSAIPTSQPNPNRLLSRPESSQAKAKAQSKAPKIIPGAQAPPSALANPTAIDSFGVPSAYTPLLASKILNANGNVKQVHTQNWRTVNHARTRRPRTAHPLASNIPSYANGITPHDPTPGSLYRRPDHFGGAGAAADAGAEDVRRYYSHAQAERARRIEAIRAVASHCSGAGLPGGKAINMSVAGHYASQASEAERKAREWEMKAARAIVSSQLSASTPVSAQRNSVNGANGANSSGRMSAGGRQTIDLHHLTVEEGTTIALEMVHKWYTTERGTMWSGARDEARKKGVGYVSPHGLMIITGKGRHSRGQRAVLGPAVVSALKRDGWRVDDNKESGYLVVKGRS